MPELPEVEVTRQRIAPPLVGARIVAVRLGAPLRWPLGVAPERLQGRMVQAVQRRGKYLLLQLDAGVLVVHLGMSGSLTWWPQAPAPGPHDHADIVTDRGTLRLHDPRRFGAVLYAEGEHDARLRKLLDGLGVEPLTAAFTPAVLAAGLRGRRAPIKQVLLAGDVVVGVGNIYASEALFVAGIRPTTPAGRLGPRRVQRLHAAIQQVLQRAVEVGGSSVRDFHVNGQSGHFQNEFWVYGRADQPCRVCGTPVRALRQGQRSSFFCPRCQR
ncbi:DNA-(apurinic or apyrimidinic site) lyase [Tepidimonas ignava]|uniref:Formamidopyrimidine-DNA glycosylase n=1 Tax=Tepidimonas ignava TaxID=114249 RepID=A0A4V2UVV7_9BURK|nr:bifunctional DNA-formamidopyrimidine glycosylase/DNA-(apurinic or apyrimidinic site) lyase [Tepidimonas ignava]TCS97307.1 DNA-(apurinic or apyrimidinic site) lyase [Tepidimonas ignava]TSE21293.1 Formamidopyrimidine-DNA glycosylase [Tepidimonas ignava]